MTAQQLLPLFHAELAASVSEVFKVQFSLEANVQDGGPMAMTPDKSACAVGVISLVGDKTAGTLVLWLPKASFCTVVNHMFSENHSDINAGNADAAAEILNMIYGMARTRVNLKGPNLQPAIPSVMWGGDVNVSLNGYDSTSSLRCSCLGQPFMLLLGLKQVKS
ncbi:MAG: chemotaxis protein CheX [Bdellovibrionales bacterium]|nr:chemotaxis protein CheX [Bdellovibrionales bacterium]